MNQKPHQKTMNNEKKKTAELSQPICLKNVLTSEWKTWNVLHWEKSYTYIFIGKKKLWVPSKLIKIRHIQGRPSENLDYRQKDGDWQDQQNRKYIHWSYTLTTALRLAETWKYLQLELQLSVANKSGCLQNPQDLSLPSF